MQLDPVNVVLAIILFFALIFCAPVIFRGWQDFTGTVTAAQNFQP